MLNRWERGKIARVLEQVKTISSDLQKMRTSLMEIRDRAQEAMVGISAATSRITLLQEEVAELISEESQETDPGA